jgi:preprotein translocase subunit SecA
VPRHPDGVRNRVGWPERLARLRGTSIEYDLRSYEEPLAEAGHLGRELATLTDDALRERVRNTRARGGADGLHAVRTKIVALIREIAARTIGLRPFDEQIVAAFALDRGAIVERGTHAELLALGGVYARLHAMQFREAA